MSGFLGRCGVTVPWSWPIVRQSADFKLRQTAQN
jgi:hypothetical protein